jgi:hypothetical protein
MTSDAEKIAKRIVDDRLAFTDGRMSLKAQDDRWMADYMAALRLDIWSDVERILREMYGADRYGHVPGSRPKHAPPGTPCHHCKEPIAGQPISFHADGKASKHYHAHHAKHHGA